MYRIVSPNNDTTSAPDAAAYVCIHSNAGGGRGTSYIALGADYEQKFIGSDFVEKSNEMGNIINQKSCGGNWTFAKFTYKYTLFDIVQ